MRRQDPIGTRLQAVRAERGLSLDDVAAKVLLSSSQIRGLEQGDVKAFYSSHFYNQGLRKYAALLGLPDSLLGDAAPASDAAHAAHATHTPVRETAPSTTTAGGGRSGARLAAVALVIAIAGASAAGVWWWRTQEAARVAAEPTPPPPAPEAPPVTQAPTLAPVVDAVPELESAVAADATTPETTDAALPPSAAVPATASGAGITAPSVAATAPATTSSGAYGTVRAGTATWVFVRYADGTTTQRTVDAGFTFTIAPRPIYLVVGSTDVVLTVRGRRIDVAPWVSEGEVRINGRAFAAAPLVVDAPAATP